MWTLDYRIIFLFYCISFVIIGTSGAVSQNVAGVRNSTKQTKSIYTGLSEANAGYHGKNRLGGVKTAAATNNSSGSSNKGLGISAWGIIGVILTVIVGGIAAYYVALFYPIVCKKQGKYDIMELSTV